jgi:hypothetical protein
MSAPALAEEPAAAPSTEQAAANAEQATARAANLFDEATRLYEAGQYAAAAEKYLQADDSVPSSEALSNAIATARKASAPLLVARAARRAIARELLDPALAERARVALNEVEPQLEQLDTPPQQTTAEETPAQQTPAATEPAPRQEPAREPAVPPLAPSGGVPQSVFWMGAAATGALVGVTVWSGLDTLSEKDALPSRSDPGYATAAEDVSDDATRTDWLLAATLVTGLSTAAIAIWAVDWQDSGTMQVGVVPSRHGAALRWWGSFR